MTRLRLLLLSWMCCLPLVSGLTGFSTTGVLPPTPHAVAEQTKLFEDTPANRKQLLICIRAIASQSDPAKLATLGSRQSNPRLKRIMYYLTTARSLGCDPAMAILAAQSENQSVNTPRAPLIQASLLRNLKICDGLGLLTPENLERLKRGNAPLVTKGPYTGQAAEVDHIVPRAESPQTDNELANLEMLPASLNRAKSDKVGERQMALAKKFHDAGLINDATLARVQAKFTPAGTGKYELQEP